MGLEVDEILSEGRNITLGSKEGAADDDEEGEDDGEGGDDTVGDLVGDITDGAAVVVSAVKLTPPLASN